jgi:hypothetical protein
VRFKVLPPAPDSLARLEAVWQAVPVVPDAEESCCVRLVRDADVPAQDEAKEWLTFARALDLAEEGPRGYSRVRGEFDPDTLAERFREHVYAADETLAVLAEADGPLAPDEVFERLRDHVPTWERQRQADWAETWTQRTDRLLEWAVLFGLADRADDGYVSV